MRLQSSFIQIDGVGERTERTLWQHGITDWREAVDTTVVGPGRRERIERFVDDALGELEAGNVAYFAEQLPSASRWRLAHTFRENVTALDIETTGLSQRRDHVTTVSLHGPRGTRTLVRDRDLAPGRLREELAATDLLVTYNGASFDLPFIERDLGVSIDLPHLDLMYPCRRLGWTGGLKAVERELGIDRDLPAVDGREAVRLWYRYRDGDEAALERLVRYNREDVRTLLPIVDHVVGALDQTVYRPYLPDA